MVATGQLMVAKVATVAFQGIAAVPVSVQVQFVPGMVNFLVVGLPDEAVAESRERPTLRRSLGKGESADPAMLLGKP